MRLLPAAAGVSTGHAVFDDSRSLAACLRGVPPSPRESPVRRRPFTDDAAAGVPCERKADDEYGFKLRAQIRPRRSDETKDCLREGSGSESGGGVKAQVDRELLAVGALHRRGSPLRKSTSAQELMRSNPVGYAHRDPEYGLGRRGRAHHPSLSPRPRSERSRSVSSYFCEVGVHETPPEHKQRRGEQFHRQRCGETAKKIVTMAPVVTTPTRDSRAEVLRRSMESAVFEKDTPVRLRSRDARKPPLPPEATNSGFRSPTRAAKELELASPSSARRSMSPRANSKSRPFPQRHAQDHSHRASCAKRWSVPSPGRSPSCGPHEDPLQRLCWDGTSESCTGRSALWDDRPGSPERSRGGHELDMFMDGGLPYGIGHGRKRDYAPKTCIMAKLLHPDSCESPDSGSFVFDLEAAGQRMRTNQLTGRGRRHFKFAEKQEDHFLSNGVAGGGTLLRGHARGNIMEGGLPRAIGAGKRHAPEKLLDHFETDGTVGSHFRFPFGLEALGLCEGGAVAADQTQAGTSPGRYDESGSPRQLERTETPRRIAQRQAAVRECYAAAVAASANRAALTAEERRTLCGSGHSPRRLRREGSCSPRPLSSRPWARSGDVPPAAPRSKCSFSIRTAPSAMWMRWAGSEDSKPPQDTRMQATVTDCRSAQDVRRKPAGISPRKPLAHRYEASVAEEESPTAFRRWDTDPAVAVR